MASYDRPAREAFALLPRRPIRVVLDSVERLPNIGTMFRLCDAFRVERLYVCGFDLQLHKRKLVTAAAGTLAWVPWASRERAVEVVEESRRDGYRIVAVELDARSAPPEALRTDAPLVLVLGAENRGVSPEVLALVDECVEIPSDGMGGSINLTTAAAITLYSIARRMPLGGGGQAPGE